MNAENFLDDAKLGVTRSNGRASVEGGRRRVGLGSFSKVAMVVPEG